MRREATGEGSARDNREAGVSGEMSSPPSVQDDDAPDLVCQIDCVKGMVNALSSVRSKRHQDALMELSQHGIVLTVEENGCFQAKVFLKRQSMTARGWAAGGSRFRLSLGLLVDCLNIFSALGSVGSLDACLYAEIRTGIPNMVSWDYHFEHDGNAHVTFTDKKQSMTLNGQAPAFRFECNMILQLLYSKVYKGQLAEGQIVAVKRLIKGGNKEDRANDFLSELGIIAHVNHPNAAQLLGFSVEGDLHLGSSVLTSWKPCFCSAWLNGSTNN